MTYLGLPPEKVEDIANALLEWAEKPDSLHLAGFSTQYRKTRTWLYSLAKNHESINDALIIAREAIAQRMFTNGTQGTYNYGMVQKYVGYFDKEIDLYTDSKEEKKHKHAEEAAAKILVNIKSFEKKGKDESR